MSYKKHTKSVNNALEQTLIDMALMEIKKKRWQLEDTDLEELLKWFFSEPLVVQSYMLSKRIGSKDESEYLVALIPLDQAIFVARTASDMTSDPWEKQVVYAASLIFPCGHFVAEHPVVQYERESTANLTDERTSLRTWILERPLNGLSALNKEKGNLMRYLLDQSSQETVVPSSWFQMRQIVQRGQVQLKCIW